MTRGMETLKWAAMRAAQRLACPESLLIFGYLAEDLIAARLLASHERSGFYVDVGCGDPVSMSNTLLLHRRGWRGINVDANLATVERFRRLRPADRNVHALVGRPGPTREFYVFENETLATASAKFRERWQREHAVCEVLTMSPRSLTEILDEAQAPRRMQFLNLDVEGLELEVLESLDADRYRFELIASEIHDLSLPEAHADPVVAHLSDRGYRLTAYNGLTAFFQLRELREGSRAGASQATAAAPRETRG